MVPIHPDRSTRSPPAHYDSTNSQIAGISSTKDERRQQRPADVVAAIYKYLSDGVKILGEAYSTYDNRNIQ
jgi:hypothetical protein